jgi:hypothetical protein
MHARHGDMVSWYWRTAAAALLLVPQLMGQSVSPAITSRMDQIEAERARKAAALAPDEPGKVEKYFDRIEDVFRRSPVRIGVGGLGPGAGFAVGSEFHRYSSADRVRSRLWGTASVNRFYSVGTGLEFPRIVARDWTFLVQASHADAPQLEYFGQGPDSSRDQRTNYRREDTLFEFRAESRAYLRFRPACRIGELLLNVGPGTRDDIPTSESVFSPAEAPGIDVQSNYLIAGCMAETDYRDLPGDPHKGTYAAVSYDRFHAHDDDRFSFHRVHAVADHYIPYFNGKRVIAMRAQTELTFHSGDQIVPFYLQPTLGSDTNLRGFRRWRFYDENSIAFTGEYRWEVNTGFDMAAFADFGKVFHRPGDISLSGLESSVGFGLRFKGPTRVVARLDTAFSHEGVQVWLKFGKLF